MSQYSDSTFSEDPNSSWFKVFNYIKNGSSVLDVGCSSGNFGKVLIERKNCIVDGVETDKSDYTTAKKRLRNVYNLNIETDSLSDMKEKYDYIYFGDVIEHLYYPVETLNRVKSLLALGGQLIFSIPNMAHISVRLMLLQGDFNYGDTGLLDKTHIHFYTVKEVERILNEADYDLVEFNPVLKDQPIKVIEAELAKVGLKLDDKFLKFTRTTGASIYQIVGIARPAGAGIKRAKMALPESSPVDIFQSLLDDTKNYYEQQLKTQAEHIKKLEAYSKETVEQIKTLHASLAKTDIEIEKLKRWNPRNVARAIKNRATKSPGKRMP
jgi:methionine biosynthesis protein MetW